jgi:hypothetical protein
MTMGHQPSDEVGIGLDGNHSRTEREKHFCVLPVVCPDVKYKLSAMNVLSIEVSKAKDPLPVIAIKGSEIYSAQGALQSTWN